MAKTRSRNLHSPIKKEESEDKPKIERMLHSINNTANNTNKITKKKTSNITYSAPLLDAVVKTEDTKDTELIASLSTPKFKKTQRRVVTGEQIKKLIGYLVDDNMYLSAAARKANMASTTAYEYYEEYKKDPEHKIPLPKSALNIMPEKITQEKIEHLINYITNENLSITKAAKKAKVCRPTAAKYYAKYLSDPERRIPILENRIGQSSKRSTQEQIKGLIDCINNDNMSLSEAAQKVGISERTAYIHYAKYINDPARKIPAIKKRHECQPKKYTAEQIKTFIGYIVNDKMSVAAAGKKASINSSSAKKYYSTYLEDPNHEIPIPGDHTRRGGKKCANDKVRKLIGYIVNDRMTLLAASIKTGIGAHTASKYYKKFMEDPAHQIPRPENEIRSIPSKPPSFDQVKDFFNYVIIDKLALNQAIRKANISKTFGYKYYSKYLKDPIQKVESVDTMYSEEKMKKMIEYVEKDKLSVTAAAYKANLYLKTALKYYRQYINDPQHNIPSLKRSKYTYEDIKKLIHYINHDKMSVTDASKKMKMSGQTAYKYYNTYQNDLEPKVAVSIPLENCNKIRVFDKYSQLVADIYKKSVSETPAQESDHSSSSISDGETQ